MRWFASSIVVLLLLAGIGGLAGANSALAFRVIVHPEVGANHVPREVLSSIYLKETASWEDGNPVAPVDQSLSSPLRAAFSAEVLGEKLDSLRVLWSRRIGAGVTPPRVKASDQAVIEYVASTRGAVGYVSTDTPLPPTVKILSVLY